MLRIQQICGFSSRPLFLYFKNVVTEHDQVFLCKHIYSDYPTKSTDYELWFNRKLVKCGRPIRTQNEISALLRGLYAVKVSKGWLGRDMEFMDKSVVSLNK